MWTITAFFIVATAACPVAQTEVLVLPLPTIAGGFSSYEASVTYTGEAVRISSVSLHVVAVIDQLGEVYCIHAPGVPYPSGWCTFGPRVRSRVWRNEIYAYDYELHPRVVEPAGDFNRVLMLEPMPGFSELASNDIVEVRLHFYEGDWCCLPEFPGALIEPEGTLISVALVIEVSDIVPVEQTTWGCIKSICGFE